jgi:hypothetical protein
MKKTITNLMLITILIGCASMSAEAQRRRESDDATSHDRSHQRENNNQHSDHDRNKGHHGNGNHESYSHDNKWNYQDRNHGHREVRHHHHNHRPVMLHRHVSRPRYIYFKDYDVYYDNYRNVYIAYSGRSWSVSASTPYAMRNVNVRGARSFEVDYHDDDFPTYLQRRRPACGQEYRGW